MAERIGAQLDSLAHAMPGEVGVSRRRAAIGSCAAMVGALILARSIDYPALSSELLVETRAWIDANISQGEPCVAGSGEC